MSETVVATAPAAPAVEANEAALFIVQHGGVAIAVAIAAAEALGAEDVGALRVLNPDDFTAAGLKRAPAKKIVAALGEGNKPENVGAGTAAQPAVNPLLSNMASAVAQMGSYMSFIPSISDDSSLMKALSGGVESVPAPADIEGACRAYFTAAYGMFGVDRVILSAVKRKVKARGRVGAPSMMKLARRLRVKRHPEIFAQLDVNTSDVMTRDDQQDFLDAMRLLMVKLQEFYGPVTAHAAQIDDFYRQNQLLLVSGGLGAIMEQFQPQQVQVAATGVVKAMNDAYAWTGAYVARGLGADASGIAELIKDSEIHAMLGVEGAQQLLDDLGVGLAADGWLQEERLIQYTQMAVGLPRRRPEEAVQVIRAMKYVGQMIPWEKLVQPIDAGKIWKGQTEDDEPRRRATVRTSADATPPPVAWDDRRFGR
jgi:hypothetical protein